LSNFAMLSRNLTAPAAPRGFGLSVFGICSLPKPA
jgi:hypothetical protein